jgi:fido (protein-threonine AMPylation protein)/DNA-binding transcriptional ArsR family regulator
MSNFDEYKKMGEPERAEKAENWQIAIGLQAVDGLKPSEYLIELAKKNIEGELTIEEVKGALKSYYEDKSENIGDEERKDEADKVSAHIAEILAEKTFTFNPLEYLSIHKRLFSGIFKHAGKIRDYNITKAEWVLDGATVYYANATMIRATLDYDFLQEREFSYKGLSKRETAEHVARFVSGLWQIHAFCEGNTRTTAVFAIKYLRMLGFPVNNDMFRDNSWFFRNALVRANYSDQAKGVFSTTEFLNKFYSNMLLGEKNILKNREMHISFGRTLANDTVNPKNDTVNATANDTLKLSATQKAIVEILSGNRNLTAQDIADDLGKSLATVKRELKALKDKGLLARVGADKTGYWKVLG